MEKSGTGCGAAALDQSQIRWISISPDGVFLAGLFSPDGVFLAGLFSPDSSRRTGFATPSEMFSDQYLLAGRGLRAGLSQIPSGVAN